jgi:hypothetical protein
VAGSVDKLADMLRQKQDLRTLLFGGGKAENSEVAHRVSVGD